MNSHSPCALIAGGSKGIGYGIAEALAKRSYNLVLIARHKEDLEIAKNKLETSYPIHVTVLAFDVTEKEAIDKLAKWCLEKRIPLKMLCNVAGPGGAKDYPLLPLDDLRYMIHGNIEWQMALCLKLLSLLERNNPSYIMNISSSAAFAPIPIKNIYSATKSALLFFSYSYVTSLRKRILV